MSGRPPEPAEDDDLRRELERSPSRHDTPRAVSQRQNQPESGTSGWAGRLIDRLLHAESRRRELVEGLDGDRDKVH
ncbi:MAG: hypothetical protein JWR81_3045 [Pseudonocardia sp.]|jgi:hypothetical protein|nr:hypothetical protein [Pseudonocardia sp.]